MTATHQFGSGLLSLLETAFLSGAAVFANAVLDVEYGDVGGFYTVVRIADFSCIGRLDHRYCVLIKEPAEPDNLIVEIWFVKDPTPTYKWCVDIPMMANAIPRRYRGPKLGLAIMDIYHFLTIGRLQPSA